MKKSPLGMTWRMRTGSVAVRLPLRTTVPEPSWLEFDDVERIDDGSKSVTFFCTAASSPPDDGTP